MYQVYCEVMHSEELGKKLGALVADSNILSWRSVERAEGNKEGYRAACRDLKLVPRDER
jgi:hypothetical protein